MAARPRKRGNKDLPKNLYWSGTSYRYKHPIDGKWISLGSDKPKAVQAANIANARLLEGQSLVNRIVGGDAFSDVLERYKKEYVARKTQSTRTASEREYRLKRISQQFGEQTLEAITLREISDFLNELPTQSYVKHRQEMVEIYRFAIAVGLTERNLPEATLPAVQQQKARKRWTQEGFDAVYRSAEPWLQNAMDIAVLTLQRREDLVTMRHDHIINNRLHVHQSKTKNYANPVNLAIRIWPELQRCIDRSRDLAPFCPFVLGRKPDRDRRGQKHHPYQVTADFLSKSIAAARDASGYFDQVPAAERPTLHELRAFGAHRYREQGKDGEWIQALLGHASAKMTRHYLSGHGEEWVEIG